MAATEKNSQSKTVKTKRATQHAVNTVANKGKEHVDGFLNFIREQGVIGLAIGLAIGVAAGGTVKSLVEGFINPIVQFIVGSQDALAASTWTFEAWGRSATFGWGAAVSSLITLIATALVIYWLVNIFRLDKLDKKKDK